MDVEINQSEDPFAEDDLVAETRDDEEVFQSKNKSKRIVVQDDEDDVDGEVKVTDSGDLFGSDDSDQDVEVATTQNINNISTDNNNNDNLFGSDDDDDDDDNLNADRDDNEASSSKTGKNIDKYTKRKVVEGPATAAGTASESGGELDKILGLELQTDTLMERLMKSKVTSTLKFPKIKKVGDTTTNISIRLPNFLKVSQEAFDVKTFDADRERELFGNAAIIRWRYKVDDRGEVIVDAEGRPQRESNAKLVKYADGSVVLIVGKDTFNANMINIDNSYIYAKHSDDETKQSSLECVGDVSARVVLQTSSIASKEHARLAQQVTDRYKRVESIAIQDYEDVPENSENVLRQQARDEEKRLRALQKANANQSSHGIGFGYRRPNMSAAYLNDDDGGNYDTFNASDARNGRKVRGGYGGYGGGMMDGDDDEMADFIVDDDEENGEEDAENLYEMVDQKLAKKPSDKLPTQKAKKTRKEDDDEGADDSEDDEDYEEDSFIDDDDEDEEDEDEEEGDDDEDEEDEDDDADEREAKKKSSKKDKKKSKEERKKSKKEKKLKRKRDKDGKKIKSSSPKSASNGKDADDDEDAPSQSVSQTAAVATNDDDRDDNHRVDLNTRKKKRMIVDSDEDE